MNNNLIKVKKGGIDTIIAYIVVSLPLLYVLIYMVATIYHFSVQTYVNQVAKEAAVMISTYGAAMPAHKDYIEDAVYDVFDADEYGEFCEIVFYRREFLDDVGVAEELEDASIIPEASLGGDNVDKGDIIGVYVRSLKPSMLGSVGSFSIFGPSSDESNLFYSAYREEIVRNEKEFLPN